MKRIGIIGTRSRDTSSAYHKVKDKFFEIYEEGDWIVSGHCKKGGDRFAEVLMELHGIPTILFPPSYNKHGKAAPFIRNALIAEWSDAIIACVQRPEDGIEEVLKRKTGGTEDTLKRFIKKHPEGKVYLV
jgi:hypothetical protein